MSERPEIVPVGQIPELGVVPEKMHCFVIRPERFGEPMKSFQPRNAGMGPRAWRGARPGHGSRHQLQRDLGRPRRARQHPQGSRPATFTSRDPMPPASSGPSAPGVTDHKVGDEVVLHCNHLVYPGTNDLQTIWGYETPDGSFAQFTKVQGQQVLPKPPQLSWEEAASYGLTYYTAHRMLVDRAKVQPGEDVLIWGAGGGLGVFAVQLCAIMGARAIAVVSSDDKAELCMQLGAHGVINRKEFPGLQYKDNMTPEEQAAHKADLKGFGKRIWDILGERKGPEVVFEHVGKATFPASVFLAAKFGRIVICGATTGYNLNFDVRHLWMRQKQIIGSHFADADSAAARTGS